MLEALGVPPAAEDVYRALLRSGTAGETELLAAGSSPDVVRESLAELETLGLVQRSNGRWVATPPDVAVESLLIKERERILERERELAAIPRAIRELAGLAGPHSGGTTRDVVEVTSDPETARRRCGHLVRLIRTEVLAFDKLPYGARADAPYDPEYEMAGELSMLRRGIAVRAVYEQAALHVPQRLAAVRELVAAGEQARVRPVLPTKLTIYDRAHAVVQLEGDESGVAQTAVIVHKSGLLDILLELFELVWDSAIPVAPARDVPLPTAEPDIDDAVIALLAAGCKDATIARQLNVSPSTVSRRVTRLMEMAGATTRLQLGIQLSRKGWV